VQESDGIVFYENDEPKKQGTSKGRKRTRKKVPYRTNIGSLKLESPSAEEFKAVLKAFGFESVPAFLRQCALSILRQKGRKLILPLEFKTVPREES
jgi:hypothetical protein